MLERVLAVWPGLRWRLGILRALLDSAAGAQAVPVLGSSRTPAEPSIAHSLLQQVGLGVHQPGDIQHMTLSNDLGLHGCAAAEAWTMPALQSGHTHPHAAVALA